MSRAFGVAAAVALLIVARARPDWLVRLIRAFDQAAEIASPRGAALYARIAPRLLGAVYRMVVEDATARVHDGETVVDLGCGPADLLAALSERLPQAHLVGVEPSEAMRHAGIARLAGVPARDVVIRDGSAEALPLPNASVDLLVSTLSAHHWRDPAAAFREIDRVLRSGGEARIYDVRFATFGPDELQRIGRSAGLRTGLLTRTVAALRLGPFHPFAVIAYRPG
ncbi:MAG TPA: class I SAM-dependent methyltransferase [Candidatus Limnocylindria bacterium]|nr:class I SAM-dependent methyltransferase [Candidatus Limnocylindria bacterium]